MPQVINESRNEIRQDYNACLILHNDPDVNGYIVIEALMVILGFDEDKAVNKTMEAHYFSSSNLGSYPLEMAEFYSEQFCKLGILVTYKK
jgi:ATP-dependent Clp protease adapter protein ClpS